MENFETNLRFFKNLCPFFKLGKSLRPYWKISLDKNLTLMVRLMKMVSKKGPGGIIRNQRVNIEILALLVEIEVSLQLYLHASTFVYHGSLRKKNEGILPEKTIQVFTISKMSLQVTSHQRGLLAQKLLFIKIFFTIFFEGLRRPMLKLVRVDSNPKVRDPNPKRGRRMNRVN